MLKLAPSVPHQDRLSKDWRRANRTLRRYSGPLRANLVAHWKSSGNAGDPRHFLSLIHRFDNGKLKETI